ncbi:response regulator [Flavobacterium sp.]|uniref:response regulator n=1 Tax=Flavobacterium sp. TaxID=239 RepID=UPI00286DC844|nr:response regulator [Flavobacterium sp.]
MKILIIDDHPSMIEGYKTILSYNNLGYDIEYTEAYNCQTAFELITNKRLVIDYDVVFLDYSLPPFEKENIFNGQDLGLVIRKHLLNTKIVILTSHIEGIILYDLNTALKPEGILVKSDFSADELIKAFDYIMNNYTYYSETAHKVIKELLSKNIFLDEINRHIITLIADGVVTKNIPERIQLSLSSIEKRKNTIRDYFGLTRKGSDEEIIREARKKGLI